MGSFIIPVSTKFRAVRYGAYKSNKKYKPKNNKKTNNSKSQVQRTIEAKRRRLEIQAENRSKLV